MLILIDLLKIFAQPQGFIVSFFKTFKRSFKSSYKIMQQRWGSITYSNHLQLDVFVPLLLMFMFIEILFGFCKEKTLKIMKYYSKNVIFPILRLSIHETLGYIEGSFCVFLIKNSKQKSRRKFCWNFLVTSATLFVVLCLLCF